MEQSKALQAGAGSMSITPLLPGLHSAMFSSRGSEITHIHHNDSGTPLTRVPFVPLRKANELRRTLLSQESPQTQITFFSVPML